MSIFDGLGFFKGFSWSKSLDDGLKHTVVAGVSKTSPHSALKSSLTGAAKQTRTVRKREFDKLRTLRMQMESVGELREPHFFQTSMHSRIEDRASTIKKIDEIEAQMSMQWWKTDRLDLRKSN